MLFYGLTQFTPNSALLQNFKVYQKTNKYRDQNSLHEITVKEVSFKWSLYRFHLKTQKLSGTTSMITSVLTGTDVVVIDDKVHSWSEYLFVRWAWKCCLISPKGYFYSRMHVPSTLWKLMFLYSCPHSTSEGRQVRGWIRVIWRVWWWWWSWVWESCRIWIPSANQGMWWYRMLSFWCTIFSWSIQCLCLKLQFFGASLLLRGCDTGVT